MFKALQDALVTQHSLGGRDGGTFRTGRLQVQRAWRLENPTLFAKYRAEQDSVRVSLDYLRRLGIGLSNPFLAQQLTEATGKLHNVSLDSQINEVYLLHGTTVEPLKDILESGLSAKHCTGGLFGKGIYFAEDAAKNHHVCFTQP